MTIDIVCGVKFVMKAYEHKFKCLVDQLNSELMSSWRRSMSMDDVISLKHLVSPANSNSCDVTTDGKSLINIICSHNWMYYRYYF